MKDKKRNPGILSVRESILRSARERLRKISIFAMTENKKTVERFEREAEKQRQTLIDQRNREISEQYGEAMQATIKGYKLRDEYRQQHQKQERPIQEEPPKPEPQSNEGNWMRSDAHGVLLGEESDDGDYLRSENVRRIYGRKA